MYGGPNGTAAYILASAVLPAEECDDARSTVALLSKPRRRFHWRDASDPDRRKAVELVASLPALHLVVVGVRLDPRRQERARRSCLRRLLFELDSAGVEHLWLEARAPLLDMRDMQAVNVFTIQGIIQPHRPVVVHTRPTEEPLLWVPDIVAGAVNAAIGGDQSFHLTLESLIMRHDIELN
jgi:hypothetical protein